nr:hypothetical protein [uncultured Pseudogulbenkiania sp.]
MSTKQQLVFEYLLSALADRYSAEIDELALFDFLAPMSEACLDAVMA